MLKQVMDLYEILDNPKVRGADVISLFKKENPQLDYKITVSKSGDCITDFLYIRIPGKNGKTFGGNAPTLGITGTLGGIGARPAVNGFVSDGDGALAALSAGLKLVRMNILGDCLDSDIIITTHICPNAPTVDHFPVPFMDCSVTDEEINHHCVKEDMDAILSIDTTKGNEIINTNGFAISNTVKSGYILSVSSFLTDIMKRTTGKMPYVFPLAQQDITPYGNGLNHMNSILQPCVVSSAPVVGIAITTEVPVAGCASGATRLIDVESAARFCVEVAKEFSSNEKLFFDPEEYRKLFSLYGSMKHYQTKGYQIKKQLGIIVMGQSGIKGKYDDINKILAPEAEAIITGIVDGYTYEQILENFWPKDDESFIVSNVKDGKIIKIADTHAQKLIQEKINFLASKGITSTIVFCTAEFQDFTSKGILLQPTKVIESMLTLLGCKKIGIMLPEKGQIQASYQQYQKYNPIIKVASPYGSEEIITEMAKQFSNENVDLILTDCMGYNEKLADLITLHSKKNVLVPRVIVPTLLKKLI